MREVEFLTVFHAPSPKLKILAIPNVLAYGKSYEHSFVKNATVIKVAREVKFRSVFRAPSRKFKILAIPNVLAHVKSYEHGFAKKHDGHKLCAKSCAKPSFDRFFVDHLRNSKYWSFPMYHGKSYEHGFAKKI
ncbi:hypothetical protein BHM03_00060840 [Ensete ventricosum]|nr:hypothetical protein BHM03_00060840 [Ensete ventricosum]